MATTCSFRLTIKVDKDTFPIPTDGNVGKEVEEILNDLLYDVEGIEKFDIIKLNSKRKR